MPLSIEEWPARDLPLRVLAKPSGKRKKDADEIDLAKCPLHELVQYNCNQGKDGLVRCQPIVRTFRRCKDFWAETTPLENPGAK